MDFQNHLSSAAHMLIKFSTFLSPGNLEKFSHFPDFVSSYSLLPLYIFQLYFETLKQKCLGNKWGSFHFLQCINSGVCETLVTDIYVKQSFLHFTSLSPYDSWKNNVQFTMESWDAG